MFSDIATDAITYLFRAIFTNTRTAIFTYMFSVILTDVLQICLEYSDGGATTTDDGRRATDEHKVGPSSRPGLARE